MSDCCKREVDTRALATRRRPVLLADVAVNVVTFVIMVGSTAAKIVRAQS